jgi:hypothetical protein
VDEEEYDEAAELSEKVDTLKEELAQLLATLQCSKDDVIAFCAEL